jgi:hypothetical protein
MDATQVVTTYLLFSVIGGVAGAAAMVAVMTLIDQGGPPGRNMIDAVGSLLTRNRENARLVGVMLHGAAAVGYALVYTVLLMAFNLTQWPDGLFAGLGLGILHGIVVSLSLVWVIADQHPLAEYRETGPVVFLSHLAGHAVYGAVIGAVVAWSPL